MATGTVEIDTNNKQEKLVFTIDNGQKTVAKAARSLYVIMKGRQPTLDGRNRAIVIAEALARVIAAESLALVGGHISP